MSNHRINRFFSVFEQPVQNEIMAFCQRITAAHADVYIFMARKAAAFCDCLEELGLIHLDGYVTTDRSLDINGEWLAGKRIVIVDDAVVSGTTLFTTVKKLQEFGVADISIQILTINERWFSSSLLQDSNGNSYIYPVFNKLPDNMCIKLCNDIVQAISLVPRPYDVDFPLYKGITVSEDDLKRILSINNWDAYDIRSDLQKENDILNLTLMPNQTELSNLSNVLGIDVCHNSIIKIRLYGRKIKKEKQLISVRIAPFFIFEEMSVDNVQKIFDLVTARHGQKYQSKFIGWSSTSQLRFLQFYYSAQLAAYWLHSVNQVLNSPIGLSYSYRNLSFLFPASYICAVEMLCNGLTKIPPNIHIQDKSVVREHSPETIYREVDPVSVNARLYEPFVEMYHEKELICRRLVLEKGKEVFSDSQYKKLRNRLNEGVSFQDLVERLRDCRDYYDIERKVSLFIDSSIDAGIIVPIIQQDNKTIFRAYRHGEDVLFGRREELMYIKMLSLFAENSGTTDGITKLSAEKLIVLFSKIGLRKKILHPYTSNFTSEPLDPQGRPMRILRVKSYLKGPVALVGSALQHQKHKSIPFITGERKALWLTNVLTQGGCLIPNPGYLKYQINSKVVEEDIVQLTDSELSFIQDFAELTGRISNSSENTGKTFSDNDWVKVSTTLTLQDTIVAVAAEMEIFFNEFDISEQFYLIGNQSEDFENIRHFASGFMFESIHNAVMKTRSFMNKRGQELVRAIKFKSNIEQRLWLDYFSDELNNNSDNNNRELSAAFSVQTVWVYLMEALVNALYLTFVKRASIHYNAAAANGDRVARATDRMNEACNLLVEFKKTAQYGSYDAKRLFAIMENSGIDQLPLINSEDELNQLIKRLNDAIEETEIIANSVKETVCAILGEWGKINTIKCYTYAVHIDIRASSQEQREEAFATIHSAYRKACNNLDRMREYHISKGHPVPLMGIDLLPTRYTPVSENSASSDIWYIGHGPHIDIEMASFAMNVFYKLHVNGIESNVAIFDNLAYQCCIKSSTSETAEYHCNQFNAFVNIFKNDINMQNKITTPQLLHIKSKALGGNSRIEQKLAETQTYMEMGRCERDDNSITKTQYEITQYYCTENRRKFVERKKCDFGIITVLPEELNAINYIYGLKRQSARFGERIYYEGSVISDAGAVRKIVCTQTINQGETSAANAYHDLKAKYHPSIVFLIGIAGGVVDKKNENEIAAPARPELGLCDVVIAKSVIDYEMRKETCEGIKHRGQVFTTDASIALLINDFMASIASNPINAVESSKYQTINVLFEAIGSGNAVVADDDSSTTDWLKTYNSKVAAVEMEASGVSSSFYETISTDNEVKGLVVVRGISDLADVDKALCKKYRVPAAQNAALIAKLIMEQFPEL